MGATELQIFVSLVVVLGAAFVALICDFLKGSNERLREANLELQVRQDQRFTAQAEHASRESIAEKALARKIYAAHQPAAGLSPTPSTPQAAERPIAGGRRRPRRERHSEPAIANAVAHLRGAPAVEITPPQAPAPIVDAPVAPAMALQVPPVPPEPVVSQHEAITPPITSSAAPASDLQPEGLPEFVLPVAEPAQTCEVPGELDSPVAARVTDSDAAPPEMGLLSLALPSAARTVPRNIVPSGWDLPCTEPAPVRLPDAVESLTPASASIEPAGIRPLAPAMPANVASRPQVDAAPEAASKRPSEFSSITGRFLAPAPPSLAPETALATLTPALPIAGLFAIRPLACSALAIEAGAPLLPRIAQGRELAPVSSGTLAEYVIAPHRAATPSRMVAHPEFSTPAGRFFPGVTLELESQLTMPLVAEPAGDVKEPAAEPLPEEPVVRIRVLREEPEPIAETDPLPTAAHSTEAPVEEVKTAQAPSALDEIFAPAAEPGLPGLVEEPQPAVSAQEERPKLLEAAPISPAWNVEPAVPRDNVVQLPVTTPAVFHAGAQPTRSLPAGWQDAAVLRGLLESSAPFTGMVACITVADFDRQISEFGAGRCEEAITALCSTIEALAGPNDLLCRFVPDELIVLVPNLSSEEQAARTRLLAELLWDFQLRALSSVPLLCQWGAGAANREPLSAVIDRAREQALESRRVRKNGPSLLGRFRRRVVNG